MDSVQRLAPILLSFQILLPLFAGLLLTVRSLGSPAIRFRSVAGILLLLAVTSLSLLGIVLVLPSPDRPGVSVECLIPLLPGTGSNTLLNHLVWQLDLSSASLLCLIPWVALSAQLFTTGSDHAASQPAGHLLLTAGLSLFIAAGEIASLMCGIGLCMLVITFRLIRFGRDEKRTAAAQFFTLQLIGGGLLAASLGMTAANTSLVQSAPFDPPAPTSIRFAELRELIQKSVAKHPAARQLHDESRLFPSGLMICGLVLMAAGFPLQVWLSEVGASASLGERLWLVAWTKSVLLVGLRLLASLDPEALRSFGWFGLSVSIPGALFAASLLFSQAYLPRIQSSAQSWTQQVALVSAFSATQDLEIWLVPLLISQLAALVLFTVGLSTISERYRSVEISSFQGLSVRTGWLIPLLLACTLTMTLTPFALGLMQVWLVSVTLQGSQSLPGSLLQLTYLLAALLAVAGMGRVMQQLCTGPLRLPEMEPVLRERTQLPAPTTTLTFSTVQILLLAGWGLVAVFVAFSFPLLHFLTPTTG